MNATTQQLIEIEKLIKAEGGWPLLPLLRTCNSFSANANVKRILTEVALEKGFNHYSQVGDYCGKELCLKFIECAIEKAEVEEIILFNSIKGLAYAS
jgi:hypothetical protein